MSKWHKKDFLYFSMEKLGLFAEMSYETFHSEQCRHSFKHESCGFVLYAAIVFLTRA